MVIKSSHTIKTIQKVAVTFADDTDLVTNGDLVEIKMQKMIDEHDNKYEATGGHIESKNPNITNGNGSGHKEIKRLCQNQ